MEIFSDFLLIAGIVRGIAVIQSLAKEKVPLHTLPLGRRARMNVIL